MKELQNVNIKGYMNKWSAIDKLNKNGVNRVVEINKDKDKEIKRLNNIINELEKYINETKLVEFEKEYGRRYSKTFTQAEVIICNMILNKLQELKGSDK